MKKRINTMHHQMKEKNIIVLSHVLTTVPAEDLMKYFLSFPVKNLLFIGHPLFYKEGRPGSNLRLYNKQKIQKKIQHKNRKLPVLVQYIKDFFLTLWWVNRTQEKWDVIIALDNLNALSALVLRIMGKVDKVIYYTIDFVPVRFQNKLLDNIYHYIDKICVKYSDLTWNISPRIAEGREKICGLYKKDYPKQRTVPIGIWHERLPKLNASKIEPFTMVYAGGLVPHQGVQVVIDAIPLIIKEIPKLKFIIIGLGSYEDNLKKQVYSLGIEKHVLFLGYMENHDDVIRKLATCSVAMAMYSTELDVWSYYADPSKIKTYLVAGLPVITTDVTHIAPQLVQKKCGVIIPYEKNAVAEAIVSFLGNKKKLSEYRRNALVYAKDFDWNTIIVNGLEGVI